MYRLTIFVKKMDNMMISTKLRFSLYIFTGLFMIISCDKTPTNTPNTEGFIQVNGGAIHYMDIGSKTAPILLLLHGGPGGTSYYLNPLLALRNAYRIVIFDQLGCGKSDRITDTNLMTIENHIDQIERLTTHLKISEFHLYGQSWGTILGLEYYSKFPEKVKSMILSSPAISVEKWKTDTELLVKTLPESTQKTIKDCTDSSNFDSPDYQLAIQEFYEKYVARKLPWSADMDSTFANFGMNVYQYMWGPSEFTATGTLKTYDGTGILSNVKVPVQFIIGEFDEVSESTAKYYQSLVPGSKLSVTSNAGHLTMQDNPEEDIETILKFLKGQK
jgi:proline iminopeptidase